MMKVTRCPRCGEDKLIWHERIKGKNFNDELIKFKCYDCAYKFTYIKTENETTYEEGVYEGWNYNI